MSKWLLGLFSTDHFRCYSRLAAWQEAVKSTWQLLNETEKRFKTRWIGGSEQDVKNYHAFVWNSGVNPVYCAMPPDFKATVTHWQSQPIFKLYLHARACAFLRFTAGYSGIISTLRHVRRMCACARRGGERFMKLASQQRFILLSFPRTLSLLLEFLFFLNTHITLYSQVIVVESLLMLVVVAAITNWGWAHLKTLQYRWRSWTLVLYEACKMFILNHIECWNPSFRVKNTFSTTPH